jgi:hypothetical protein
VTSNKADEKQQFSHSHRWRLKDRLDPPRVKTEKHHGSPPLACDIVVSLHEVKFPVFDKIMEKFENLKILLFINFCISQKQIQVRLIINTEGKKSTEAQVYNEQ